MIYGRHTADEKRARILSGRNAKRATLLLGVVGITVRSILLGVASVQSGRCAALLGLNPPRTVDLACSPVSNGVEPASYRCAVPAVKDMVYGKMSALLTSPEGRLLGRWDAPIAYDAEGKSTPKDSWGPLDTSARLVDDGDGVFGSGDVFHLDSVQLYRFGGAQFVMSSDCWSATAVLQ